MIIQGVTMSNNRIFNVANLINKRYQNKVKNSDMVIDDIREVVCEVYGTRYVSENDIIKLINLMSKYSKE